MVAETSPSLPPEEHYAKIAIVGFGAVGASILAQQVTEIEHLITANPENPPLVSFTIYNEGPDHGHGQAYDLHKMHFRLNFPVHCAADEYNVPTGMNPSEVGMVGMHLLDSRKSDLLDYLEERRSKMTPEQVETARETFAAHAAQGRSDNWISYHDPATYRDYRLSAEGNDRWGAASYLPRAFYREYLLDIFDRTKNHVNEINERYGFPVIRLNECIDGLVTGIESGKDKDLTITCNISHGADPANILTQTADSVVIATGHHNGPMFDHVSHEKSFANTPLSDTEIFDALDGKTDDPDKSILIIGTGASYVDVLKDLDAIGFKGKITAISSDPIDYWPFDPRKTGNVSDSAEFVAKAQHLPLKDIQKLLVETLHSDAVIAAGPQNFLSDLKRNLPTLVDNLPAADAEGLKKFHDTLSVKRTAPQGYEVFRRFKDAGNIEFVGSRMSDISYDQDSKFWQTKLANGQTIVSDAVCDCAGLATRVVGRKGEIYDPLIRTLVEKSAIASIDQEQGLVVCAGTNVGQIAFAGPAGRNNRGLPFTRHFFATAAQPTLETALERAAHRRRETGLAEMALVP